MYAMNLFSQLKPLKAGQHADRDATLTNHRHQLCDSLYKALEPGKVVHTEAWADRRAAEAEIEACRKRFAEAAEHGDAGEHGEPAEPTP